MRSSRSRATVRGESYTYGNPETYAKDMEKLLAEEKYCDTRFLAGSRVQAIYGHKAVVASRCSAINSILLPNGTDLMQSSRSSHLIKDVESDVFRLVLRFIYTNSIRFDNLKTHKLIELLRASLRFQLTELAKLIEAHLIDMINEDTVFGLLNIAVKHRSTELTNTAMKFIIRNGQLLSADNAGITSLTPAALIVILQSDDLPVDEMTLFRMAVDWAEYYCSHDGHQFNHVGRSKSIIRSSISPTNMPKLGQYFTKPLAYAANAVVTNKATKKRRARTMKAVSEVMSMIRYALLTPDQLKEIEEKEEYRELIPTKCLTDAWRILTFKQTGIHVDGSSILPVTVAKRRNVVQHET